MSAIEDTLAEAAERGAMAAITKLVKAGRIIIDPEAEARVLESIRQKKFITIPEAVQLYRCSDSFLYDQIRNAPKSKDPIPFRLFGGYVIEQKAFLEWEQRRRERKPKTKLEAVRRTG